MTLIISEKEDSSVSEVTGYWLDRGIGVAGIILTNSSSATFVLFLTCQHR
jgi:hypothetical protein